MNLRGLIILIILLPAVLWSREERKMVYAGTFTGDPRSYLPKVNLVSGDVFSTVCICRSSTEREVRTCVIRCIENFEKKAKGTLSSRCVDLPRPADVVIYGVGNLRMEVFSLDLFFKGRKITATYPAIGLILYGTGFCGVVEG